MIIYFADRQLNVIGSASTSLPGGFRISEDILTESIDTGINIFSFKVSYDEETRANLEAQAAVGNFIFRSGGRAFSEQENTYSQLFQIIETEFDTKNQELYIYSEDAGLNLINTVVGIATFKSTSLKNMLMATIPNGWTINLIDTPSGTKDGIFDSETTATDRINAIADLFECEVFYTFMIEQFTVSYRILNVIKKRGNQTPIPQLRLNHEIDRMVTKKNISNLATALAVTGGTPKGSNTPVNLKNYTYQQVVDGDTYKVDKSTGQMRNVTAMGRWGSNLENSGLIVRRFTYDTTDKQTLAMKAQEELRKICKEEVTYEVEFSDFPNSINIGDKVNIIDDSRELYLEARVLKLEFSASNNTISAELGDYVVKSSGISEKLIEMAKEYRQSIIDATSISVSSSEGVVFDSNDISTILTANLYCGVNKIVTEDQLHEMYGENVGLQWYEANTPLYGETDFQLYLNGIGMEDVAEYVCKLEEIIEVESE